LGVARSARHFWRRGKVFKGLGAKNCTFFAAASCPAGGKELKAQRKEFKAKAQGNETPAQGNENEAQGNENRES